MAKAKPTKENHTAEYGNDSISQLQGADRVRLRPGVIFGSDGLDGCEHAVFEILSNSIDEAREGYGDLIILTYYRDKSIEVEDFGRGCPLDWNSREQRWNWELVYCELYAGGKYNNNTSGDYGFALGLNGLGACATQYASRYMEVTVRRDGYRYDLRFERGNVTGEPGKELRKTETDRKKTGTVTHWLPDLDVFTDIDIPPEYFDDVLKRQAVANAGVTFRLRLENSEYRIHRTGGAGTVACPWPSDRWSVVRLGGERFADFLLLFDASIPEIVSQVPAILGAIRERELEERRREMARGIGKAAVRSLLEQHLLPLGLSARFSLGEDGLVTLEMSRQESARLVVPLEDLAGTLGDLESVLLMLTARPARIVDGDAEK